MEHVRSIRLNNKVGKAFIDRSPNNRFCFVIPSHGPIRRTAFEPVNNKVRVVVIDYLKHHVGRVVHEDTMKVD